MTERRIASLLLLGVAGLLLPGHSPYLQWYAYRAKHLIVVADQERLQLASEVASALAAGWPESKAIAAGARSPAEVVSLLRSGQLQVGLLPTAFAQEALEGRGRFKAEGGVPLRAVATAGEEVLVVLESFAADRAHAISRALAESPGGGAFAARPSLTRPPIPLHPGALRYYRENLR